MCFNYGLEKKNFDSQWAVTRKQYENAGMRNEAIQAMYDTTGLFLTLIVLTRTIRRKLQLRPLNRAKNPTRH